MRGYFVRRMINILLDQSLNWKIPNLDVTMTLELTCINLRNEEVGDVNTVPIYIVDTY